MNLNQINLLNKSYRSEKKNITLIIEDICSAICRAYGEKRFSNNEIYLAIDEAVSNAMEHGNKWDKQKLISINVFDRNKEISIIIKDEGNGFDTSAVSYELDRENIFKHRGRGIFIMNRFCELKWNSTGNILEMKIRKKFLPVKTVKIIEK